MWITVDVDMEFKCQVCGSNLDVNQERNGGIEVEPCDNCMRDAREDGIKEGESNVE